MQRVNSNPYSEIMAYTAFFMCFCVNTHQICDKKLLTLILWIVILSDLKLSPVTSGVMMIALAERVCGKIASSPDWNTFGKTVGSSPRAVMYDTLKYTHHAMKGFIHLKPQRVKCIQYLVI